MLWTRAYLARITLAAFLLLALHARGAEPASRPTSAPAQAYFDSAHFMVVYHPDTVTLEQARQVAEEAERAWRRNETVFGSGPKFKVILNLHYDALVWVGLTSRNGRVVSIRYLDLPYLGVPLAGLLTHEITHVFCAPIRPGPREDPYGPPLAEGIAECVSGPYAKVPLAPWMGRVAQEKKFWFDPTGYFITGDFDAPENPNVRLVVATYVEEGVFVQHLVKRFGWKKFILFNQYYTEARHTRFDNATLRRLHQERLIPDPAAVRAVFKDILGVSWEELLAEWNESMRKDFAPNDLDDYGRMVLELAVLNCEVEFKLSDPAAHPDAEKLQLLRRQQIAAQQALDSGELDKVRRMMALLEDYAATVVPVKSAPTTRPRE